MCIVLSTIVILDQPNNFTCSGTKSEQSFPPVEVQNSVGTQETVTC